MSPKRDGYMEYLQLKRTSLVAICDAKQALADAECNSDLIDIDEQLRQCAAHPGPGAKPTVDELSRATKTVQQLESQIESLDTMTKDSGLGEAMRPLIDGMMRPMLATQLERAEEYRSEIQKALEETPQ